MLLGGMRSWLLWPIHMVMSSSWIQLLMCEGLFRCINGDF